MQPVLVSLVMAAFLTRPGTPAPTITIELPVGGWATITPDPLPDNISAGAKVQLSFLVKQHGQTPLAGLKPTVLINQGEEAPTKFAAEAGKAKGYYTATLVFARAGEWHITIESGFGNSKTTMPIQKVAAAVTSR
jgi:hypothetical protein